MNIYHAQCLTAEGIQEWMLLEDEYGFVIESTATNEGFRIYSSMQYYKDIVPLEYREDYLITLVNCL